MFRRALPCVLLVLISSLSTTVWGQGRNKRQQRENLRAAGTIKGLSRGVIYFLDDDGGKWILRLPERRQNVIFNGTAKLDWLTRGMLVRFTGEFDSKGKSQSPITDLEVFNLREGYKIGIFPDQNLGVDTSGLFSGDVGDDLTGKKKKKKKRRPKKKARPKNATGKFFVSGRLSGVKGNRISVAAGGTLVQAEVDPKVRISVQLNDIRYIRDGDKVQVEAWYPQGQKDGRRAVATKLTITAAQPLEAVKRPSRKTRRDKKEGGKKGTDKKDGGKKKEEKKDEKKKGEEKKDVN